ncbi:MAG: hypothetical protein V3V14_07155 [Saprospiraceae bacterium]
MTIKNLIFAFSFIFLFSACSDEHDGQNKYSNPIFVVNQGKFNDGSGSLTYSERGDTTLIQHAYATNNEDLFLGNVVQSMIKHDGKYYTSINNGGRIVILGTKYLNPLNSILINQPRQFASNGDQIYVSSWGDTGSNGAVYEINTKDNTLSEAIISGNGPEGMVIDNNLLYVAKGGGFGVDSVVVIIDTHSNTVVSTLTVGDNPEQIIKGNDDNIYVICNGYFDWMNPENSTDGKLVTIKDKEITNTLALSNGANRLAFDREENTIYFQMNGSIKKIDFDNSPSEIIDVATISGYALAFDDKDGQLYIGDAKDFNSMGSVSVYDREGKEVRTFDCGIIPSAFVFD